MSKMDNKVKTLELKQIKQKIKLIKQIKLKNQKFGVYKNLQRNSP